MRLNIVIIALLLMVLAVPAAAVAETGQPSASIELAQFDDDEIWTDSGQLITEDLDRHQITVSDPVEGWNRFWFEFNDALYFGVLKPVAQGYKFIIPERPRGWITNFFDNLMYPIRLVGCLLQGKFDSAGMETSKFIINTTIGLGGLADLTEGRKTVRPIPTGDEDIGQAFGVWGMGPGPYLVWPVLGPSSSRDTVGYVGEYFISPISYVKPWYLSLAIKSYERLHRLSSEIGRYESIVDSSVDPYAAVRDAYLKLRVKQISE